MKLLDRYEDRFPHESKLSEIRTFIAGQPRCFENECFDDGHITGSAWVVNAAGDSCLLTHHAKWHKWLQPGGHCDGDPDVLSVAIREAQEETGLEVEVISDDILDIDIHRIPAYGHALDHLHYDIRFLLCARGSTAFKMSSESLDMRWIKLKSLQQLTDEESVIRMAMKFNRLRSAS